MRGLFAGPDPGSFYPRPRPPRMVRNVSAGCKPRYFVLVILLTIVVSARRYSAL